MKFYLLQYVSSDSTGSFVCIYILIQPVASPTMFSITLNSNSAY